MSQTAATVSVEDTLYLHSSSTTPIASDILSLFSDAHKTVQLKTVFTYKERVRLSFNITNENFALVRGLIEFTRPKELKFVFNRAQSTLETDAPVELVQQIHLFLLNIDTLFLREKNFKTALKSVIKFEKEYRTKQVEAYHNILQFSSAQLR